MKIGYLFFRKVCLIDTRTEQIIKGTVNIYRHLSEKLV
jgi:hypothetical protein